jgi:hypothetical protein
MIYHIFKVVIHISTLDYSPVVEIGEVNLSMIIHNTGDIARIYLILQLPI